MNILRLSWLGALVAIVLMTVSVTATEPKKRKVQLMSTGETPEEYIDRKVKTHDVMVFARSYGKQNEQTKLLLRQISQETMTEVEFLDLDLMEGWDGSLLLLALEEKTGQWALPNIFIGGKHVGGNNNIDQMHAIGDLQEMVRKAGKDL